MSRRDRLKEMEPAGRRATAALCRALALVLILALFPAGLAEAPEPNEVEPNEVQPNEVQPNEVEPGEVELGEVDLSSLLEPDGKLPTEAPGDAPADETPMEGSASVPEDVPVEWEAVPEGPSEAAEAEEAAGDAGETPEEKAGAAPAEDAGAAEAEEAAGDTGAAEAAPPDEGIEMEPETGLLPPEDGEDGGDGSLADIPTEPDLRLGVGEKVALKGGTGYVSDAPAVAEVNEKTGALTGMGVGYARITATGKDGAQAAWLVAVLPAPDAIALSETKLRLGKGEKLTLTAMLPEGTASAKIAWSSGDKSVVTVDGKGNLKAKKKGSAVITAKAFNGVKAKCRVQVVAAPSKVKLSSAKLVLCVGETGALKAKLPSGSASRITWISGDSGVVAVDASGALTGLAPGVATVRAVACNGKKASCRVTVLAGAAPTALSPGIESATLGVGEKLALNPSVGEGEATVFAFSSGKKKVASVSAKGVITGKKKGTAAITVKTHNGLRARVNVKVVKAPASVAVSRSELSMRPGETARLSAWVSAGSASAIAWASSDTDVVTVDGEGNVTALKPGKALVRARTYNKKKALCAVTVSEDGPSVEDDPGEPVQDPDEPVAPADPTAARMVANLRSSGALGAKREAVADVVALLMDNGFEPAFAAGVGANVLAEGTYGLFESSRYVTNPKARPRYFCYLDGGKYYTKSDGKYKLTAVYLSAEEVGKYTGKAEPRQRFAEKNFYLDNYSKKYAWEVDLNALEALMERLSDGGWEGKFGLGIVQWTGSRTKKLVACYRKHAGKGAGSITAAQVVAAENEMIVGELKGNYIGVYNAWKQANKADPDAEKAARSAGSLVCTRYEIPADKESKAVARGNRAVEIYRIMMGG